MKLKKSSWLSVIVGTLAGTIAYLLLRSNYLGFSKEIVGETIVMAIILFLVDYLLIVISNKTIFNKENNHGNN